MVKKSWLMTAAIISGFIITGVAIFANRIGFDHNSTWGTGRIFALAIGILIVVSTFFFSLITSRIQRVYFLAGLTVLLVIAAYVWFVSVGYWTNWPKTTNYFDMLATSFQHHQLALQMKVDPLLLAMPDPYNIYAREALPHFTYLFDGSLYQGKYYLYWGPIPALILVPFKFAFPGEIGDQALVFAFVSGLFIFQSLLIIYIWERFFENLPVWTVLLGILLAGLVTPTTWMLNLPRMYEASIQSGQFFLIGGVYFAFTALDRPTPSIWRLVLTGIFWSFAVGSRNVLALPVIFMTMMIVLWIIQINRLTISFTRATGILIGLLLPMVISAGLLGWYNWARFGSILETGLRFQISGINYRDYYNELFSTRYALLNLRYYLFTPYKFIHGFPFIRPISISSWPSLSIPAPAFYYAKERVSGLLYSSPFLLFAFIAVIFSGSEANKVRKDKDISTNYAERRPLKWLSMSLLGITGVSFITLILYYYCTMRFIEDFIPALSLLSVLGFWQGYKFLSQKKVLRFGYSFFSIGMATFTIATGMLLGVSSYTERFRYMNPSLFNTLIRFFTR